MNAETWEGVRERVLALRRKPGAEKIFGAQGHGFLLGPALAEGEVRSLEEALGGPLPAEYRTFLLTVGAGGAGPDYGLLTPVRTAEGWEWRGDSLAYVGMSVTASVAGRLFEPERMQALCDAHDEQEPQHADFTDDEAFRTAYGAWDARYEELYDRQHEGAVFISEQGCGYYSLLALTGEHAGTIWWDLRAMDRGLSPTGRGFAEWYLAWLDRTERTLAA